MTKNKIPVSEPEPFNLKKFFFGKIGRKIFIYFTLLAILFAISSGIIFHIITMNYVNMEIESNLKYIADARTDLIEAHIDHHLERIKLITSRTQLKQDIFNYLNNPTPELKQTIRSKLNDSATIMHEVETLCVVDLQGEIIQCTEDFNLKTNVVKENFFTNGLKKETVSFVKLNNEWKMIFSGPIKENNEIKAMLITIETFDELDELLKEKMIIGQSGEVIIAFLDDEGNRIYPIMRLFEEEAKYIIQTEKTSEPMKVALNGQNVFFENALDYRNVETLAVSKYLPSIKLGIVSKIDRSEVITPIQNQLILITSLVVIFVFLGFGFISYLLSKSISRPIEEVTFATIQMSNQQFDVKTEIHSGDELEELGEAFNKTMDVLANLEKEKTQIEKAKTEFLSITSHELRSPMTPMKAQLQMVLGNYFGKLTKQQKESLQIVLNNTERLDKIIVDFLEISRIEAARLKFNFIKADLPKTIDLIIEEMKGFMPEKNISFKRDVAKIPSFEFDPDRFSQVLRNLMNNAIKFSPNNSTIEITAKLQSNFVSISVKDQGIGIADKDKRRLFEPFYQVDNMYQHKSGGTGLGLAICRGIVESQTGKIWLNSQTGKGTIFYFTLPLKPVREIRAIKLLFSQAQKSNDSVKILFKEYLGPLGENEFDNLNKSEIITTKILLNYIGFLIVNKILDLEKAMLFKREVIKILEEEQVGENIEKNMEKKIVSFFERGKK